MEKSRLYAAWSNQPISKTIHWLTFSLLTLILSAFLLAGINPQTLRSVVAFMTSKATVFESIPLNSSNGDLSTISIMNYFSCGGFGGCSMSIFDANGMFVANISSHDQFPYFTLPRSLSSLGFTVPTAWGSYSLVGFDTGADTDIQGRRFLCSGQGTFDNCINSGTGGINAVRSLATFIISSTLPTSTPTPTITTTLTPTPTPVISIENSPTPTPTPVGTPPIGDTVAPQVNSLTINTLSAKGNFILYWNVSDQGGSHLNRVEIVLAVYNSSNCSETDKSGCVWKTLTFINSPVGVDSWISSVKNNPGKSGKYWYGLQALDNAGNRGYEPAPIKITKGNVI